MKISDKKVKKKLWKTHWLCQNANWFPGFGQHKNVTLQQVVVWKHKHAWPSVIIHLFSPLSTTFMISLRGGYMVGSGVCMGFFWSFDPVLQNKLALFTYEHERRQRKTIKKKKKTVREREVAAKQSWVDYLQIVIRYRFHITWQKL